VLTSLDPLLAGFTEPAARIIDPSYRRRHGQLVLHGGVGAGRRIAGTIVTEKIVEPRLGQYDGDGRPRRRPQGELSAVERRACGPRRRCSSCCSSGSSGLADAPPTRRIGLRADDGTRSPPLHSIVALMLILFLLPGLAYGIVTGSDRERQGRRRR
jgi:aminobenzoyl-glutamate transport protein